MLVDADGDGWTIRENGLFDRDDRPAGTGWISREKLEGMFGPLRAVRSWDADMTPDERAAAVAEEVRATREGERKAPLPDSWSDPRTANLLGNYATR